MNSEYTHIKHEFEPVFDKNTKILVLGTIPSVKSRENNFYYGHPQNRFWKLIAALCDLFLLYFLVIFALLSRISPVRYFSAGRFAPLSGADGEADRRKL